MKMDESFKIVINKRVRKGNPSIANKMIWAFTEQARVNQKLLNILELNRR